MLGLSADMPGTRRGAPDSRRPARAGIPTELPATIRCRSGFCGDVARAARRGASRATAPRRLSGHAAGGVPRGGGGERSPWPPRRVRVCRGGSGSRCARGTGPPDNAQGRALPGRLVGWRVGDARDLTRSRGFAAADPGERLHLPALVVEVHVAARRLRGIVPLGIRPNGTIPLRGRGRLRARPDPSKRRRAFYYAQSGSRDSPAQYAVRSAIGNTKTCRPSQ